MPLLALNRFHLRLLPLRNIFTSASALNVSEGNKGELTLLADSVELKSVFPKIDPLSLTVSPVVQAITPLVSRFGVPTDSINETATSLPDLLEGMSQILKDYGHKFDSDTLIQLHYSSWQANIGAFPFMGKIIQLLESRVGEMSVETFSKFMFVRALERKKMPPKLINLTQNVLLKYLDVMSFEQIGLCCYGYFRTESRPTREEISRKIFENVLRIKFPDTPTSSVIFKFLRFVDLRDESNRLRILYENITRDQLDNLKYPLSCIHLLKLGEKYFSFNSNILEKALEFLLTNEPSSFRLKDLCEIMRCCAAFAYTPSKEVLELLRNLEVDHSSIYQYPAFYAAFACNLALYNVIRHDLIENILQNLNMFTEQNNFLFRSYSGDVILLMLHTILSIRQHEKYKGRLLDDATIRVLQNYRIIQPPPDEGPMDVESRKTRITISKLYDHAKEAFGERVFLHRIFPYSVNLDICVADDVKQIDLIKKAPLAPNSVSGCTVFIIRQGVHYGNWQQTRYRSSFRVREELLAEMGFNVRPFFWADIEVATSNLFLREEAAKSSITKQLAVYSKLPSQDAISKRRERQFSDRRNIYPSHQTDEKSSWPRQESSSNQEHIWPPKASIGASTGATLAMRKRSR